MIKVKNISKYYGKNLGISDLSFEVKKNEIIGLLGKNGAGKTTAMNIICGYISSNDGSVEIDGYDIVLDAQKAKRKIGYLPEKPPIYMDMTVNEYLNFCADLKGIDSDLRAKHIDEICALTRIKDVKTRLCKNLSKGYRQRVGLAQALVGNPEILILDEPTIGLDPNQIIEIRELIKSLSKNHTIIISSHVLSEIAHVCKRVIILDDGKVAAADTLENLTSSHTSHSLVKITLTNSDENTAVELKKLKDVISAEYLGKSDENSSDYMISCKNDVKARESVFNFAAVNGKTLLMMKPIDISLEDVFMKVTTKRGDNT